MPINNIQITETPSLSTEIFDGDYFYSILNVPTSLVFPTISKTFTLEPNVTVTYSFTLNLHSNSISTSQWAPNSHIYTVGSLDNKIAFFYSTNPITSLSLVKQGDIINNCTVTRVANYYKTGSFLLCIAEISGTATFVENQTYNVNNDSNLSIIVHAGRGIKTRGAILGVFETDYKTIKYITQYNNPDIVNKRNQQDITKNYATVSTFTSDYSVENKMENYLFNFPLPEMYDEVKIIQQYSNSQTFDSSQIPNDLLNSLKQSKQNQTESQWTQVYKDIIEPARAAKTKFESNKNFSIQNKASIIDGVDKDTQITITSWREYPQNCGHVTYPLFSFTLKDNNTAYSIDIDESKIVNFTLYYTLQGSITVTDSREEQSTSVSALSPVITYYSNGTVNSIIAESFNIFTIADYNYALSKKATWKIKTSTDLIQNVTENQTGPFTQNNKFTFLTENVNLTQTTIPVINTNEFTDSGYISIPSYEIIITDIGNYEAVNERRVYKFNGIEIIYYSGKTTNSFTGCIRGVFGTSAKTFSKLNSRVINYSRQPVNQYLPYKLGPN